MGPILPNDASVATADEQWLFHMPVLFAVTLPDGSRTRRPVMRRKVEGQWRYRLATHEEEADFMSREAW